MSQINHAIPSIADGNLATRILANPAASMDAGHTIPTFQQLDQHLMGLKYNIFELTQNVARAYSEICAAGFGEGEPAILTDRLLFDSEELVKKLNEIGLRHQQEYKGPARNSQESDTIVYNSTEATEHFTAFMMQISLSVQRLQEIHIQIQLANQQPTMAAEQAPAI